MAKAPAENKGTRAPATPFGGATIPNLEPFLQASNKILETWMVVSTQMLEFGKQQLDQSLEAGKAISKSASLNEAIDLQQKYTRTVVQDYLSEANKLADLGTRSFMDTLSAVQKAVPTVEKVEPQRVEAAE
jgi:hypothetical protein